MSSNRIANAALIVITLNLLAWTLLSTYWGGTGLGGEIADGQYLIRRQPNAPGTPVSPEFWMFTLIYSTLTFGISFLGISVIFWLRQPHYARGWVHHGAVLASLVWLLGILAKAIPRYLAWHAA